MGLVLKGIEIENFNSYIEKQFIRFSDLSVLLGVNSSGKSTALQALFLTDTAKTGDRSTEEGYVIKLEWI